MNKINGSAINTHDDEPAATSGEISSTRSYLVACGLVCAAAAARYLLGLFDDGVLLFAMFYPVILVIAFWRGTRPALFATALSLFVVWFALMPPHFEFVVKERATWINFALFCFSSGFLIWIADRHRKVVAAMNLSERRRRLLVEEMRHRSKNSISVASTIISRSLRHEPATAEQLIARLRIVLAPPDIYAETEGIECLLHRLLLAELKPYGTDRFALNGEHLQLSLRQARNLALIVHELATNSAKYGGLSVVDGFLFVTWRCESGDLVIDWKERGHNGATANANVKGFGTRLIETMIRDLKGQFEWRTSEAGYECRISFPENDNGPRESVPHKQVGLRNAAPADGTALTSPSES